MTISILISTYKRERPAYLNAALQSIWTDQTRKPDQIVLVEDGPLTDELEEVVQKWKSAIGEALTIVANKENRGLAMALNDGLSHATGDLIARMDSDDVATPSRLRLQEQYMEAHEDVDILGGAIHEFNDDGTLDIVRQYPTDMHEVRSTIHRASPLAHPTVMFRRRFFDAGFRYSNKHYICEDITLWFEAVKAGRIINNLPDVLLNFRRNNSVMQRRGRKKAWSEFRAYCEGIYGLHGAFSPKSLYPVARLMLRLSPTWLIRRAYNSRARRRLAKT